VAHLPRPAKSFFTKNIELSSKVVSSLSIRCSQVPPSRTRVALTNLCEEYTWTRPTTVVVDAKSADRFLTNHGDMLVTCMANGIERYRFLTLNAASSSSACIKFDKTRALTFDADERLVSGAVYDIISGVQQVQHLLVTCSME